MNKITKLMGAYITDESGATALEYALIAALIGVSIIAGASRLAADTDSAWDTMTTKVENVG